MPNSFLGFYVPKVPWPDIKSIPRDPRQLAALVAGIVTAGLVSTTLGKPPKPKRTHFDDDADDNIRVIKVGNVITAIDEELTVVGSLEAMAQRLITFSVPEGGVLTGAELDALEAANEELSDLIGTKAALKRRVRKEVLPQSNLRQRSERPRLIRLGFMHTKEFEE